MKSPQITLRKTARELAYTKHHLSLTSNEQVKLRLLKKIFLILFSVLKSDNRDQEVVDKIRIFLKIAAIRYLSIAVDPTHGKIPRALRNDRTIDSFDESNCKINFRFLKPDLFRLFNL